MTDKQIAEYLKDYIKEEMNLLEESDMPKYQHEFSKSFSKKMQRMLWSEKYFGSNLYIGYTIRRIAVIVFIVASVFVTNQVSAKVFGFDVWEYVVSFLTENDMEEKTYIKKDVSKHEERIDAKKDVPQNIPEYYMETARFDDADSIYVEWNYEDTYLQYNRIVLAEGMSIVTDAEYDYKENINILGYECEFCVKDDEVWIIWDDKNYRYQVIATNVNNSKEMLVKIAEDIYQ